jgi:hypothetical protein
MGFSDKELESLIAIARVNTYRTHPSSAVLMNFTDNEISGRGKESVRTNHHALTTRDYTETRSR